MKYIYTDFLVHEEFQYFQKIPTTIKNQASKNPINQVL